MKKIFTSVLFLFFITQSFASVVASKDVGLNASDIFLPIGNSGKQISLAELSVISVKQYQLIAGKKLKLSEKIAFKISQKKLRNMISEDGTVSSKKFEHASKKGFFDAHEFNIGGFLLGFFLSLTGVLISYFINDDAKEDRVYWAWRGFVAGLVIFLGIVLGFRP